MLQAVIFDMDGTLLDSEIIHYIVIHEVLMECLGYDEPMEEYMEYCGTPDPDMWFAILMDLKGRGWQIPKEGGPSIEEMCAEFERLHWEKYDQYIEKNGVVCFPGVKELFEALKKEGIKIGIGTGSLRRVVEKNLEMMGIGEYVDAVSTSEDSEHGKPAPDVFLTAAAFLKVDPVDCLVVEDSGNGLLAAKRAGMSRVGFDGSQMPSDTGTAPFVFSDYTKVTPGDFYKWHSSRDASDTPLSQ